MDDLETFSTTAHINYDFGDTEEQRKLNNSNAAEDILVNGVPLRENVLDALSTKQKEDLLKQQSKPSLLEFFYYIIAEKMKGTSQEMLLLNNLFHNVSIFMALFMKEVIMFRKEALLLTQDDQGELRKSVEEKAAASYMQLLRVSLSVSLLFGLPYPEDLSLFQNELTDPIEIIESKPGGVVGRHENTVLANFMMNTIKAHSEKDARLISIEQALRQIGGFEFILPIFAILRSIPADEPEKLVRIQMALKEFFESCK